LLAVLLAAGFEKLTENTSQAQSTLTRQEFQNGGRFFLHVYTVQTNPITLYKPRKFEKAGFSFSHGPKTF